MHGADRPSHSTFHAFTVCSRTDGYQRVCHEPEEIKRAAQTRQPWTLDELVRTTSGVVSFLETIGKLIQTVLQHDTGDYLVINAENAAIVRGKIADVLLLPHPTFNQGSLISGEHYTIGGLQCARQPPEVLRWNCLLDGRACAYPVTRRKTHSHSRSPDIIYIIVECHCVLVAIYPPL